ncbi:imidazole glycerol phosphate synthase subunit HisF [candidate division KSB1 bacterium]|nr:MAG: imidazole glycerol phosphate synthase subunit HisF [candidate division KSB1 bacterium]
MLVTRIIPCLDVEDGRVVKGIKFKNIKDAGDPVELAALYNQQGADELTFLDIGASYRSREIMIEVVDKVSSQVFIPLTVGGGIREVGDMRRILNAGADKVAICTAAIKNPSLISEGAEKFGSQCIVLSIDAKRDGDSWSAYINGGRVNSGIDALKWTKQGEQMGAGEILLNSIDMDGTKQGYDLELNRTVSELVNIPLIASGGAGTLEQMLDAIVLGKADAVLLASLLHYGEYRISDIKNYLKDKGVTIR